MRRRLAEISSLEKRIWNSLTTEGQEAYRDGVSKLGQQLERRFILELKEHIMDKSYLTHGLKGLDVDFFLHENKVLRSDSDVAGVQMHHLSKRAPWVSCPPSDAFISYRIIMYFTAGVAGVFSALHHMWKPLCKQKKSVGSWFDAESAPLLGSSRERFV